MGGRVYVYFVRALNNMYNFLIKKYMYNKLTVGGASCVEVSRRVCRSCRFGVEITIVTYEIRILINHF